MPHHLQKGFSIQINEGEEKQHMAMTETLVRFVAIATLAGISASAGAIIMRHDKDRSGYVLLGDQHRETVAMLGLLAQQDGSPMLYSGMGTLIAPQWIL